jgi:hypothetical protein
METLNSGNTFAGSRPIPGVTSSGSDPNFLTLPGGDEAFVDTATPMTPDRRQDIETHGIPEAASPRRQRRRDGDGSADPSGAGRIRASLIRAARALHEPVPTWKDVPTEYTGGVDAGVQFWERRQGQLDYIDQVKADNRRITRSMLGLQPFLRQPADRP